MSKRFRQTLTIQTNSEIKFKNMIASKQIKKVRANLHINISKIHPEKLFNLLKRLIQTKISTPIRIKVRVKTHIKKIAINNTQAK